MQQEKWEPIIPDELLLNQLRLFSFISKIFWLKYKQVSYLISFIYLTVIAKLKFKFIEVKPVTFEYFEDLIRQNSYDVDLVGDLHSCALLSINTLVALTASNRSWLKVTRLYSDSAVRSDGSEVSCKKYSVKIKMPSLDENSNKGDYGDENYYIQCLCISNAPRDFVLYVTDVKLYNIIRHWEKDDTQWELINKIEVQKAKRNVLPQIAETVSVADISSASDYPSKDMQIILGEYFKKPKCCRVNEIFEVDLREYGKDLVSRSVLLGDPKIYFQVNKLTGKSESREYYVLRDYTSLFLISSVHGYLPPKNVNYISTNKHDLGFELPLCPYGLSKYYERLRKIFKLYINSNIIEVKPIFLLSGLKGIGKKTVLRAVAASLGLHLIQADCFDFYGLIPSLVQGKLDQLFAKSRRTVPCIVFLENIELLGREQNHNENARLIDIFETHINHLWIRKPSSYPLIMVGSTHSKLTDIVAPIARMFVQTITFEPPTEEETYQILEWLTQSMNVNCSLNELKDVANRVKGYVFGDLVLLMQHVTRFQNADCSENQQESRSILLEHFEKGIEIMEAAYSDSIGAAHVPSVRWDDVGGLTELKEEIILTLNLPLQYPKLFASGLKRSGIMFYGPPGTGKTLMAKAIATECNYNFLSVKGPELMNMYVGQSEKNVREVFERARGASPCIIFFDEFDSLAPSRGRSGDSGGAIDRVVSQLLTEMDGLEKNKGVFIIAATNRPDLVDPALLRPGRFDKMFYIGVCDDPNSKLSVLKALTRKFILNVDVDLEKVVEKLPEKVTGADLYSVCYNAWSSAARRAVNKIDEGLEVELPLSVEAGDFEVAVNEFTPSLSAKDIEYHERYRLSKSS